MKSAETSLGAAGTSARATKTARLGVLFGSFLLLLADADFEVRQLGFLKGFVIVTLYCVFQVAVHISVGLKDHFQREAFIADRAKRAKALNVGDTHTITRLAQLGGSL